MYKFLFSGCVFVFMVCVLVACQKAKPVTDESSTATTEVPSNGLDTTAAAEKSMATTEEASSAGTTAVAAPAAKSAVATETPKLLPDTKAKATTTSPKVVAAVTTPSGAEPKQQPVAAKTVVPAPTPAKPQEKVVAKPAAADTKPALSHKIWDDLLRKNVNSGLVDYAAMKQQVDKLDEYLDVLAQNPPSASWPKSRKIAYWINAYNANTVKLIVKNYPVKSIRDLDGGDPWAKKWIKIGGDMYSLNQIEKEILLKQLDEPRVHFAVNCAAMSCPPLLGRAYEEGSLEATLTQQTKAFLTNTSYNKIAPKSLELSKIFDWYAADFGNDVVGFVRTKSGIDIKDNPKVTYLEYNWKLNGK